MNARSNWMKKSLLATAALAALITCTGCEQVADATGDGFGDDTIQGEDNGFPTNRDPNVPGMGSGTGPVDDNATPATAAEKIAELQGIYPIQIDGDWTIEALGVLENVLGVYRPDPSVLSNIEKITMIDRADASLGTNRLLGVFHGKDCATAGVNATQCWQVPSAANDPRTGVIAIFGNSLDSTLGAQMTGHDVITHEIGHFFSESVAKDTAWRTSWRNEAMLQPFEVSDYSTSSEEEFYAELWSKLYTERDKTLAEVQWTAPNGTPRPEARWSPPRFAPSWSAEAPAGSGHPLLEVPSRRGCSRLRVVPGLAGWTGGPPRAQWGPGSRRD
jgi:predicted Zn-dependent protease with MMP-like domain